MIELHPEILKKNGNEFVVLPYEEYAALTELLEDYEDLMDLRAAKKEDTSDSSIPLSEVKKDLGL
jgi:hypothetical protein